MIGPFVQVLRVFASRGDQSTFVKVPLQNGQHKTISLQQLSQMDEVVHTELYIDLVQQILREMPKVSLTRMRTLPPGNLQITNSCTA